MEFIKPKKFMVAQKDGKQFYNNSIVYNVSVIKIRPYVIGSSYGGSFGFKKFFFYYYDKQLPITDVVDQGSNKCSFKLNGVNATAETKANPYGGYNMCNGFNQGDTVNFFSNMSGKEGTEAIDIVITFAKPINITRLGWTNHYAYPERCIKGVEIYYKNKIMYRTPEADKNKVINIQDIDFLKLNLEV